MRTSKKPAGRAVGSRSSPRRPAVSRTGVLVLAVACAVPLLARPAGATSFPVAAGSQEQPYQRLYREGLMALWGGRWDAAAGFLREAVEARPESHAEPQIRIVGNREMPYLPHYYLGQATFELGDCRAALAAWEESLRQGVVAGANLTVLRNRRDQCFRQVAPEMTAEVQQLIERAGRLQDDLAELQQQPALARRWSSEPGLGPKQEEAVDELGQARTNLDEGQVVWGMRMLELSGEQARHAVSLLQEVEAEARRILDEEPAGPGDPEPDPAVQEAAERARSEIAAAEEAARSLDPLRRDPALQDAWRGQEDFGARESQAVEQLSGALADLRDGEASGDVSRIEDAEAKAGRAQSLFESLRADAAALREEMENSAPAETAADEPPEDSSSGDGSEGDAGTGGSTPDAGTADAGDREGSDDRDRHTSAAPSRLQEAARTLLVDREYDRVIDMLERAETEFQSSRARAHALLFRAAARHALYRLGGETQPELAEEARRDILACRRADPGLRPLESYFSPRFLNFFAQARD